MTVSYLSLSKGFLSRGLSSVQPSLHVSLPAMWQQRSQQPRGLAQQLEAVKRDGPYWETPGIPSGPRVGGRQGGKRLWEDKNCEDGCAPLIVVEVDVSQIWIALDICNLIMDSFLWGMLDLILTMAAVIAPIVLMRDYDKAAKIARILHLPLHRSQCKRFFFSANGVDASLALPFSLRFGVGRGGTPDLQLKIFQFYFGETCNDVGSCAGSIPIDHRSGFVSNLINSGAFALRVGGVVMGQILFPGAMSILGKTFCTAGLTSFLFGKLSIMRRQIFGHSRSKCVNLAGGVSVALWSYCEAINEFATQLAGPFTAIFVCHLLWKQLHKRSHVVAESSVALMKVSRGYNRLRRSIAAKRITGAENIEQAWLREHKAAAQQVAHLMDDLPDSPPLGPFLDWWESLAIWACLSADDGAATYTFSLSEGSNHFFHLNKETRKIKTQQPGLHSVNDFSCATEVPERNHQDQGDATTSQHAHSTHNVYSQMDNSWFGTNWAGQSPAEGKALSSSDDSIWDSCENMEQASFSKISYQHPGTSVPRNDIVEKSLPLFGRADHSQDEDELLTAKEKLVLAGRAMNLLLIFLPILLFGGITLLLAQAIDNQQKRNGAQKLVHRGDEGTSSSQNETNGPPVKGDGAASWLRSSAFHSLCKGCRKSGAAFIKWGQWSSTRGDLFPKEFCDTLSELHDQAPVHSLQETRYAIENSFGVPLEELFEDFDNVPLASGSIAQVHRAVLRHNSLPVVVKVRHPKVESNIRDDFRVLKPLAAWASAVPMLKGLPLKESVSQFSHTMTAQADLRVEAVHVQRMFENFECAKESIVIPTLVHDLVSESVIVETFEEGKSVAHFIKNPGPRNPEIVALGVDAYLKMLLKDNVVHTDLHPGNILVREVKRGDKDHLQIVLIDFGLVEELQPVVRKHFISFLNMISKGDGAGAAEHFLQWSDHQECLDPEAFTSDMVELFREKANVFSEHGIDLDGVVKSVLNLSRKHRVSVDSKYAALVIGVCVIVGFATGLDPRVNVMDAATPVLLTYSLTGRVVGRMYG